MRIGIFDSGIGGLNITAELLKYYQDNEYFYYADNKNVPYGNKDYFFIKTNVFLAMDYFMDKGCKVVIIACNTVSTMLGDLIKKTYPFTTYLITPNYAEPVINYEKTILFATNNTAIYLKNHTKQLAHNIGLSEKELLNKLNIIGLDNLASLTEQNAPNFCENYRYIRYIVKYINKDCPIILGCTHYTFYQKYLESLGYKCFSEISYFPCQQLKQKSQNICEDNTFSKNLTIKLTDYQKIDKFFTIIEGLL